MNLVGKLLGLASVLDWMVRQLDQSHLWMVTVGGKIGVWLIEAGSPGGYYTFRCSAEAFCQFNRFLKTMLFLFEILMNEPSWTNSK